MASNKVKFDVTSKLASKKANFKMKPRTKKSKFPIIQNPAYGGSNFGGPPMMNPSFSRLSGAPPMFGAGRTTTGVSDSLRAQVDQDLAREGPLKSNKKAKNLDQIRADNDIKKLIAPPPIPSREPRVPPPPLRPGPPVPARNFPPPSQALARPNSGRATQSRQSFWDSMYREFGAQRLNSRRNSGRSLGNTEADDRARSNKNIDDNMKKMGINKDSNVLNPNYGRASWTDQPVPNANPNRRKVGEGPKTKTSMLQRATAFHRTENKRAPRFQDGINTRVPPSTVPKPRNTPSSSSRSRTQPALGFEIRGPPEMATGPNPNKRQNRKGAQATATKKALNPGSLLQQPRLGAERFKRNLVSKAEGVRLGANKLLKRKPNKVGPAAPKTMKVGNRDMAAGEMHKQTGLNDMTPKKMTRDQIGKEYNVQMRDPDSLGNRDSYRRPSSIQSGGVTRSNVSDYGRTQTKPKLSGAGGEMQASGLKLGGQPQRNYLTGQRSNSAMNFDDLPKNRINKRNSLPARPMGSVDDLVTSSLNPTKRKSLEDLNPTRPKQARISAPPTLGGNTNKSLEPSKSGPLELYRGSNRSSSSSLSSFSPGAKNALTKKPGDYLPKYDMSDSDSIGPSVSRRGSVVSESGSKKNIATSMTGVKSRKGKGRRKIAKRIGAAALIGAVGGASRARLAAASNADDVIVNNYAGGSTTDSSSTSYASAGVTPSGPTATYSGAQTSSYKAQ